MAYAVFLVLLKVNQFLNEKPFASSERPDVVLIHGTGGDGTLWTPQVEMLTPLGYRCIVPELRGHGQTPEPGDPCDLNTHIEDLIETLQTCQIRFPAIFVGHSLGAMIACMLAERHPEMFSQILSISMPGRVPKHSARIFDWFLGWPYGRLKGTFIHRQLPIRHRILLSTDLHSLQQIVSNFADVNFVEHDFAIACPVHFSVGNFDVVAPAKHVRAMHKRLPGSTLQVFKWAGHSCMDDQPDAFNKWFMDKIVSI